MMIFLNCCEFKKYLTIIYFLNKCFISYNIQPNTKVMGGGESKPVHEAHENLSPIEQAKRAADQVKQAQEQAKRAQVYAQQSLDRVTGGGEGCIYGGCGCVLGGLDDLASYEKSIYSRNKQDLVKKLAKEIGPLFGLKKLEDQSMKAIYDALKKKLPNPASDRVMSKAHVDVCKKLAVAVNNVYGAKIIDPNASAEEQCQDASELMNSLFSGLHSEFVVVAKDVRQRMDALETLLKVLDSAKTKLIANNAKVADGVVKADNKNSAWLMDEVIQEANKQMAHLKHMLNVAIQPAEKDMLEGIRKRDALKGFFKKLNKAAGTQEFGEKLAHVLSGVEILSYTANVIQSALKEVGMSVDEYKKTDKLQDLSDKLYTKLQKLGDGNPTANELHKFMQASELLKLNNYRKDNIVKALGGKSAYNNRKMKRGGDDDNNKLGDQVKRQRNNRKIINRDFSGRVGQLYKRLLADIDSAVKKVGFTIPLSDNLDAFGRALERMNESHQVEDPSFIKALLGEYEDSSARDKKQRFIKELKNVADAAGRVDSLKDIKGDVDAIVKTIDEYSDILSKTKTVTVPLKGEKDTDSAVMGAGKKAKKGKKVKKGGDEYAEMTDSESDAENVASDSDGEDASVEGGADCNALDTPDGHQCLADVTRVSQDLGKALSHFHYFHRVARIRANLTRLSVEQDSYNKQYEEVLGDAIGQRMSVINKTYADLSKSVDEDAAASDGDKKKAKEYLRAVKNARVKLYKTLEAVDIYLGGFADGIAKHPDDLGDLLKMLESLQVNVKWYTEQAGDNFALVFDEMPSAATGNDPSNVGGNAGKRKVADHYWKEVIASSGSGDPFLPLDLEHVETTLSASNKAVCAITVLKNIVSIFVSIGKRFGGEDLLSKCPMSPTQIYKNLTEYTYMSAFTNVGNGNSLAEKYRLVMRSAQGIVAADSSTNNPATPSGDGATSQHFDSDDQYFVMMLQAMVAKVLTAVGTYTMLNKPRSQDLKDKNDKPTSALRQILGANEGVPDVHPEAAELYIRLPLLLEFYRELHDVRGAHPEGKRITLIPEFDNVWSGLVDLVYNVAHNVEHGTYSDSQVRDIVREVNEVWRKYKAVSPKDTVREVVLSLVAEMNRRYGIYCQSEIKAWLDNRKYRKSGPSQDGDEATNFEILPNEGEPDYPRPSPSDRYVELSDVSASKTDKLADTKLQRMLFDFRKRVTDKLTDQPEYGDRAYSMDENMRQVVSTLKSARSAEDKYNALRSAVQGSGRISMMSTEKLYAFNETVGTSMVAVKHLLYTMQWFVDASKTIKDRMVDGDVKENLKDIVDVVWSLSGTADDLVQVRIDGSDNLLIDTSPLTECAERLLRAAKNSLDKFRPLLSKATVQWYETGAGESSMQQLDDKMDVLVRGKYSQGVEGEDGEYRSVNDAANDMSEAMQQVVSRAVEGDKCGEMLRDWVQKVGGDRNAGLSNLNNLLVSDVVKESRSKLTPGTDGPGMPDGIKSNMHSNGMKDAQPSLLFSFNNLVANVANQAYDSGMEKLYASVFEEFVNGAGYRSVMEGKNVDPTKVNQSLTGGRLIDMQVAFALKRLYIEQSPKSKDSRYLVREVSDLPEYTRENLRNNLCYAVKYLHVLLKRVALIKSLVNSGINMNVGGKVNGSTDINDIPNYHVGAEASDDLDDKSAREYMNEVLGQIVDGSNALLKGFNKTLKDLDDAPVWGELSTGSNSEYRAQNGMSPLAPVSMLLNPLVNTERVLMPVETPSSPTFKYNNAVRAVHCAGAKAQDMSAVNELLDAYNAGSTADSQLSKDNYHSLVNELIKVSMHLIDAHIYGVNYIKDGLVITPQLNNEIELPAVQNDDNAVKHQRLVSQMESSEQRKVQKQLGSNVHEAPAESDVNNQRSGMRVLNIVDLNIVPVNFHALRREIPLVNLFNYAYTFEKLVSQDLYSVMSKIVTKPYGNLDAEWDESGGDGLMRMMVGAMGNGMGRPKFLSDQLWNKALFKNLYKQLPQSPTTNMAGPVEFVSGDMRRDMRYSNVKTIGRNNAQHMNTGKNRFDTRLTRNIMFFVCLHMVMRSKMQQELERIDAPVVQRLQALNRKVTEFENREQVSNSAPYVE